MAASRRAPRCATDVHACRTTRCAYGRCAPMARDHPGEAARSCAERRARRACDSVRAGNVHATARRVRWRKAGLMRAGVAEDACEGPREDPDVEPERPVADVVQVVLD